MTSLPSSAGGPYGLRDIRSLYPAVTENHLRYLEKWGLLRHSGSAARPARVHVHRSAHDPQVVGGARSRHAAAADSPHALAEREGSSQLDFVAGQGTTDTPRAKVVSLEARKPARTGSRIGAARIASFRIASPNRRPRWRQSTSSKGRGSTTATSGRWRRRRRRTARRSIIDPDLVPAIVNLANIHYAPRRADRGAGALRARHRPRSGLLRGALQPRQHPARPRPLRSRARLLPRRGRAQPRLRRRALLSRGHAGEDRALTGSEAALEGVSGARAEGEWMELAREFLE